MQKMLEHINVGLKLLGHLFFSRTAVEWNKYLNIKHVSHLNFKYHLLKEIPPPD